MSFSEKVTQLRHEHSLTQEAFAEAMGVSRQTICKWESGAAMPDVENLMRISDYFGISMDELVRAESPCEPSTEPTTISYEGEVSVEPADSYKPPRRKSPIKIIVAALLVVSIVVGALVVPKNIPAIRKVWWNLHGGQIDYTYVLVHGLGGFGESEDNPVSYWGATTGNLPEFLRSEGYTVAVPTVGPYSSTWDRACELYAQLTGGTVDYGKVHANVHHHSQFGRTYEKPLVENWGEKVNGGQRIRINLVGHSFGGATVRLLTSLLANGNAAEKKASGSDTSPLFTGGKDDWVYSVTTLCAPHNGSQLTCIVDELGSVAGINDTTQLLVSLLFKALKSSNSGFGAIDLMLDQFGIGTVTDNEQEVTDAIQKIETIGIDHAFYDLSPDGAAELNKSIETVDSVYYFSYAYSTLSGNSLLGIPTPNSNTFLPLMVTAAAMGSYSGTTPGGIAIDDTWHDNDGLVSVVSAAYPTGAPHADWTDTVKPGIWNVAPTQTGDHGTAVGLLADVEETHVFYTSLFKAIDALR